MKNSGEFSQAQQDALEKAFELLNEHFDASVICAQANAEDDDHAEDKTFLYHGGLSTCLGLSRICSKLIEADSMDGFGRVSEDDED